MRRGPPFFFFFFVLFCFFFFHFSKWLKFVLGLPKLIFSTGKKTFHAGGKNQEKWLCPLRKIFLLRPCLQLGDFDYLSVWLGDKNWSSLKFLAACKKANLPQFSTLKFWQHWIKHRLASKQNPTDQPCMFHITYFSLITVDNGCHFKISETVSCFDCQLCLQLFTGGMNASGI